MTLKHRTMRKNIKHGAVYYSKASCSHSKSSPPQSGIFGILKAGSCISCRHATKTTNLLLYLASSQPRHTPISRPLYRTQLNLSLRLKHVTSSCSSCRRATDFLFPLFSMHMINSLPSIAHLTSLAADKG